MKKTKFREMVLGSGTKLILGKDENSNDELMKKYGGRENIILHTSAPGSPFGVIKSLNPGKEEIYEAGVLVASRSQNWRDNKSDVTVDVFTGKDVSKPHGYKTGSWKVKKPKKIRIKKRDIINREK